MVNKDEIDGRCGDKIKNLSTFSKLQKPIRADYLTSKVKKAFNLL